MDAKKSAYNNFYLLFTLLLFYFLFLSVFFTPDLRVKRTGGKKNPSSWYFHCLIDFFSFISTACSQQPLYHLSLTSLISRSHFDDHQVLSRTLINTDTEVSRLSFSRATTIRVNATRTIHKDCFHWCLISDAKKKKDQRSYSLQAMNNFI